MAPLPDSEKAKDVLNGVNIVQLNDRGRGGVKGQVIDIECDDGTKERTYKVRYENGVEAHLTADEVRKCLQIEVKCPRYIVAYHVTAEDNVENIRKNGFQSGTNPRRLRIGEGPYFLIRKGRALKYLQRLSTDTGKVYKLLTCSIRTDGTFFYAGERCFFKAEWVGGAASVVLGRHFMAMNQPSRFHELVIKDPKQAKLLAIDQQRLEGRFRPRMVHLPILPKHTGLSEYVASHRSGQGGRERGHSCRHRHAAARRSVQGGRERGHSWRHRQHNPRRSFPTTTLFSKRTRL